MKIGFLGLGKMGKRIVVKLLEGGHEVVVWNRSKEVVGDFLREQDRFVLTGKLADAHDVSDFQHLLSSPRIFWSMLPAGEATESALSQIDELTEERDIVIDGGNSFYKDTQKWYEHFSQKSVGFLGIGVSGGILAADNGFPMMAGGDKRSYEYIKPLLEVLSQPHGGFDYFGKGGAGHFVKMAHNGVEYGMMQSIAEGFGVLEKSPFDLDLEKIAYLWTKNTIVAGFLMDRTKDALAKDPNLENIIGEVDATGEATWTVDAAREEGVMVPVIEESLAFRKKSKIDRKISSSFVARMVAALRHEFGGHNVKQKELFDK